MTDDTNIHEDAKSDWMKLVKKHKKKQKGLPALSKLNTNAGNVEHNIKMFNTAATPVDGPSNNPVSGPFGGDVSGGMCESLIDIGADKIVLNYTSRFTYKAIQSLSNPPSQYHLVDTPPTSSITPYRSRKRNMNS